MPTGSASEPLLNEPGDKYPVADKKPTWLSRLQIPGLTLRRTWLLAHVLFAICTFSTLFVYSYQAGTVIVGLIGICWAVALWAPFALISAEVSRIDVDRRLRRRQTALSEGVGGTRPPPPYSSAATATGYAPANTEDDAHEDESESRPSEDVENGQPPPAEENLAQVGIILGLHNVAISFPQILSSLVCSAVFKAAQKPRGEPWDDSVGWVLRFAGCAALVAAWLTKRLAEGPGR
jgi:solute carrier family 45 protein 1/2/4